MMRPLRQYLACARESLPNSNPVKDLRARRLKMAVQDWPCLCGKHDVSAVGQGAQCDVRPGSVPHKSGYMRCTDMLTNGKRSRACAESPFHHASATEAIVRGGAAPRARLMPYLHTDTSQPCSLACLPWPSLKSACVWRVAKPETTSLEGVDRRRAASHAHFQSAQAQCAEFLVHHSSVLLGRVSLMRRFLSTL
jgi:hypothetical protein